MIKQIAWNTFKNTGNIDTFMELIQVENAEKNVNVPIGNVEAKDISYGEFQNKGNNITRK